MARVAGPRCFAVTPSWTVYRLACQRLLRWLRVTFAMVPDAAWPGSDQRPRGTDPAAGRVGRLGRPSAPDPWGVVCSCPSLGRLRCARLCGVLGHFAPVQWCACSVCCVACAVSWATWLLFTGVPGRCAVFGVRCPGPIGSCSPVCSLRALCCVCSVRGHLAPVPLCAHSGCFVALRVRCPGPLGYLFSAVAPGALSCVCGVVGHLSSVHRCACSLCCVVCAVS